MVTADRTTCGCDDVFQSDYRGSMNTIKAGGEVCLGWDEADADCFDISEYPNAGLDKNVCCNPTPDYFYKAWCFNPLVEESYYVADRDVECNVPSYDTRACGVLPSCKRPSRLSSCHNTLQADECCKDDNGSCNCIYLKNACQISLENTNQDFSIVAEIFISIL